MPGAYAHITVVNHAHKRARSAALSPDTKFALGKHLRYAELGAVSPDYPYLASGQGHWADRMHYLNTATLLEAGVEKLGDMSGTDREKATAWLFGFAAHMTTDMTIHPIVEAIVGPYAQNKSAHRRCEMHQDTFIFEKMDLGDVGLTEHLRTGIASCVQADGKFDGAVSALWLAMLAQTYPGEDPNTPPRPDRWHDGFTGILQGIAGVNRLFPFSRHVATNLNLTYPERAEVLDEYVAALKTPEGALGYGAIFDRACTNVVTVWEGMDRALTGQSTAFFDTLEDWNLDTGRTVPGGRYVFWKEGT